MNNYELKRKAAIALATLTALGGVGCASTGEQTPTPSISESADPSNEATPTATSSPSETPSMDVSSSPTAIETPTGIETTEQTPSETELLRDWSINYNSFKDWETKSTEQKVAAVDTLLQSNGGGSILVENVDYGVNHEEVIAAMYNADLIIDQLFWDKNNLEDDNLWQKVMDVVIDPNQVGQDEISASKKETLRQQEKDFFEYGTTTCVFSDEPEVCDVIRQGIAFDSVAYSSGIRPITNKIDGSERTGIIAVVIGRDPTEATEDVPGGFVTVDDLVANLTMAQNEETSSWQIRGKIHRISSDYQIPTDEGPKDVSEFPAVAELRAKRLP